MRKKHKFLSIFLVVTCALNQAFPAMSLARQGDCLRSLSTARSFVANQLNYGLSEPVTFSPEWKTAHYHFSDIEALKDNPEYSRLRDPLRQLSAAIGYLTKSLKILNSGGEHRGLLDGNIDKLNAFSLTIEESRLRINDNNGRTVLVYNLQEGTPVYVGTFFYPISKAIAPNSAISMDNDTPARIWHNYKYSRAAEDVFAAEFFLELFNALPAGVQSNMLKDTSVASVVNSIDHGKASFIRAVLETRSRWIKINETLDTLFLHDIAQHMLKRYLFDHYLLMKRLRREPGKKIYKSISSKMRSLIMYLEPRLGQLGDDFYDIVVDEKGHMFLVKKRDVIMVRDGQEVGGFGSHETKNSFRREKLAYLIGRGRVNICEVKEFTRSDILLNSPDGFNMDNYFLVRLGMDYNTETDEMPQKNITAAVSAHLVYCIFIRKFDNHQGNRFSTSMVPLIFDNDVAFDIALFDDFDDFMDAYIHNKNENMDNTEEHISAFDLHALFDAVDTFSRIPDEELAHYISEAGFAGDEADELLQFLIRRKRALPGEVRTALIELTEYHDIDDLTSRRGLPALGEVEQTPIPDITSKPFMAGPFARYIDADSLDYTPDLNNLITESLDNIGGPSGRGPSSSHTGGPYNIGNEFRDIFTAVFGQGQAESVEVELYDNFAFSGVGHGTKGALCAGLMGASFKYENEPTYRSRMKDYEDDAAVNGVLGCSGNRFKFISRKTKLPNMYNCSNVCTVKATSRNGHELKIGFASTGGSIFRVFFVSLDGNMLVEDKPHDVMLFGPDGVSRDIIEDIFDTTTQLFDANTDKNLIIAAVSDGTFSRHEEAAVRERLGGSRFRVIRLSGYSSEPAVKFSNAKDLIALCKQTGKNMLGVLIDYQINHPKYEEIQPTRRKDQLMANTTKLFSTSFDAIRRGVANAGPTRHGFVTGQDAQSIRQLLELSAEFGTTEIITDLYATALAEENAREGIVVYCPTAGSAGIVPAALMAFSRDFETRFDVSDQRIAEAYIIAEGIGALINHNASIAGADVGCQGEVGAACAMAAAGLVYLMGGSDIQILNAASFALSDQLGKICDPTGGAVEVPCVYRNGIESAGVWLSVYRAFTTTRLIDFDSIVSKLHEIGKLLPDRHKEQGTGGGAVAASEKRKVRIDAELGLEITTTLVKNTRTHMDVGLREAFREFADSTRPVKGIDRTLLAKAVRNINWLAEKFDPEQDNNPIIVNLFRYISALGQYDSPTFWAVMFSIHTMGKQAQHIRTEDDYLNRGYSYMITSVAAALIKKFGERLPLKNRDVELLNILSEVEGLKNIIYPAIAAKLRDRRLPYFSWAGRVNINTGFAAYTAARILGCGREDALKAMTLALQTSYANTFQSTREVNYYINFSAFPRAYVAAIKTKAGILTSMKPDEAISALLGTEEAPIDFTGKIKEAMAPHVKLTVAEIHRNLESLIGHVDIKELEAMLLSLSAQRDHGINRGGGRKSRKRFVYNPSRDKHASPLTHSVEWLAPAAVEGNMILSAEEAGAVSNLYRKLGFDYMADILESEEVNIYWGTPTDTSGKEMPATIEHVAGGFDIVINSIFKQKYRELMESGGYDAELLRRDYLLKVARILAHEFGSIVTLRHIAEAGAKVFPEELLDLRELVEIIIEFDFYCAAKDALGPEGWYNLDIAKAYNSSISMPTHHLDSLRALHARLAIESMNHREFILNNAGDGIAQSYVAEIFRLAKGKDVPAKLLTMARKIFVKYVDNMAGTLSVPDAIALMPASANAVDISIKSAA